MAAKQKPKIRKSSPRPEMDGFIDALNLLYLEAMELCVKPKVQDTFRHWMTKAAPYDGPNGEERQTARAMVLAIDLEIFTPSSMTGATNLDRLGRRRKLTGEETAALTVLKQARFTPLRIVSVRDNIFFYGFNPVTQETVTVLDGRAGPGAAGFTIVARLCPLPDGTFAAVGPVTPIDESGLAVVMDFAKPGKEIAKETRCAAAVYRHVVRHGGPNVPGFYGLPERDGETDDAVAPKGASIGPLDQIAKAWAASPEAVRRPAGDLETIRRTATPDMIVEMLFKTSATQKTAGLEKIAVAYRQITVLQMETLQSRARVGSGLDRAPFDTIARAIAYEIAHEGYPREAAALFEALRKSLEGQAKSKQSNDGLTRVIERIQALRAKTIDQGCTESEALAAAKKVAELLDRYGLSLSEIDIKEQSCEGFGIESTRKRTGPLDDCFSVVAAFCDCRAWFEKTGDDRIRSVFFGLPADVEAARYLYERVAMAFETETRLFQAGPLYQEESGGGRRTATASFQIGLSRGINFKLKSLKSERDAEFKTLSGRDLVPVKTAAIEEDLAKLGLAFTSKPGPRTRWIQKDAFEAGEIAGRQFEAQSGLES